MFVRSLRAQVDATRVLARARSQRICTVCVPDRKGAGMDIRRQPGHLQDNQRVDVVVWADRALFDRRAAAGSAHD